jgi:hypothetical protein
MPFRAYNQTYVKCWLLCSKLHVTAKIKIINCTIDILQNIGRFCNRLINSSWDYKIKTYDIFRCLNFDFITISTNFKRIWNLKKLCCIAINLYFLCKFKMANTVSENLTKMYSCGGYKNKQENTFYCDNIVSKRGYVFFYFV